MSAFCDKFFHLERLKNFKVDIGVFLFLFFALDGR